MPLLRKILNVGDSQAVTLPKSWLRTAEDTEGKKVIAVAMEVDGSIILNPVFEKETKASVTADQATTTSPDKSNLKGGIVNKE